MSYHCRLQRQEPLVEERQGAPVSDQERMAELRRGKERKKDGGRSSRNEITTSKENTRGGTGKPDNEGGRSKGARTSRERGGGARMPLDGSAVAKHS